MVVRLRVPVGAGAGDRGVDDRRPGWLVGQPLRILLVAAAHAALWVIVRASRLRDAPRTNTLSIPALAWLAYAGWEWLVVVEDPDANIRVDLLLIAAVALATLWGWNP